jgi:serpin B
MRAEPEPRERDLDVGRAVDALAAALCGHLAGADENLAFSPASIAIALAMTAAGARGTTQRELLDVLHVEAGGLAAFADLARELARGGGSAAELALANRMFGARGCKFEPDFVRLLARQFGSPLELLAIERDPEAARRFVNEWVAQQTRRRILDLLPQHSVASDTRMLIANAVSFRGEWRRPFAKEATRPAPFRTAAGKVVDVATMHAEAELEVAEAGGCTAVQLGYRGGELAMLLVLPPSGESLARWDAGRASTLAAALAPATIVLALPRFAVEAPRALRLRPALEALGAASAFDAARADLTGIVKPEAEAPRLFVGEVWHQAFVRVDEKGTEAAAATVVGGAETAMPRPRPREVTFDRPFWLVLRHLASGVPLFLGRIAEPA